MRYRVIILEHERGWGSKISEEKYFDTREEADSYRLTYNMNTNLADNPSTYFTAQEPQLVDMSYINEN